MVSSCERFKWVCLLFGLRSCDYFEAPEINLHTFIQVFSSHNPILQWSKWADDWIIGSVCRGERTDL